MALIKLALALSIFSFSQNLAQARIDVLVMTDSPQFIEQVNEKQGIGTISSVYSLLFEKIGLPEQLRYMPFNRQERALDQSDKAVCTPYRFKSAERAKKYIFSTPIYLLLHYRLYQQAYLPDLPAEVLDTNSNVKSLLAIAERQVNAKFLIISNNSYGDVLDKQISRLPSSSTLSWNGSIPHNKISNLFFHKRGEYALIFPSEMHAYTLSNPNAQYKSYRISNVDSFTYGYMMCNKHPKSYEYLDLVNNAIKPLYSSPEYLKAHLTPYSQSEHPHIINLISQLTAKEE